MVKKEVRESGLLFLYLHGTAGVTLSVVLQPIISQILIKWPLMLVFALSQRFCFVKLSLHAVLAVGQVILSVIHTGRSPLIPPKKRL